MNQKKIAIQLYEKEFSKLVFFAYSIVNNKEAAYDITADLFEKIFQRLADNQGREELPVEHAHFRNTLYFSLKNKCFDHNKVTQNRKRILDELPRDDISHNNNIEKHFEQEALELVKKQLSHRQKEILDLNLEGYNHNEIAEELDISYSTVRNTLSTSKKKIKEIWNRKFKNE